MALDVADLETKLPAAVIAAVAGSPAGLVTAGTQVYVARTKRTGPTVTSPEAWLRAEDVVDLPGGLGHLRRGYRYILTIEASAPTAAQQQAWSRGCHAYFHGGKKPNATGLWACRVEDVDQDLHDGRGPAAAVRLRLVFQEE